jgi:hypothetical protein
MNRSQNVTSFKTVENTTNTVSIYIEQNDPSLLKTIFMKTNYVSKNLWMCRVWNRSYSNHR